MAVRVMYVDPDAMMVTHCREVLGATDCVMATGVDFCEPMPVPPRSEPNPTRSVAVVLNVVAMKNRLRPPHPMQYRWTSGRRGAVGEPTLVDPGMVHLSRPRPELGDGADPDVGENHSTVAGVRRRD